MKKKLVFYLYSIFCISVIAQTQNTVFIYSDKSEKMSYLCSVKIVIFTNNVMNFYR